MIVNVKTGIGASVNDPPLMKVALDERVTSEDKCTTLPADVLYSRQ